MHHAHVARAADGARLAQRNTHPVDAEVLQEKHGDALGQRLNQVKFRLLDECQHALRDPLVVEGVVDGIRQRRFGDVGTDFNVDDDGLLDLAFPIENADDCLGLESMNENLIHLSSRLP